MAPRVRHLPLALPAEFLEMLATQYADLKLLGVSQQTTACDFTLSEKLFATASHCGVEESMRRRETAGHACSAAQEVS